MNCLMMKLLWMIGGIYMINYSYYPFLKGAITKHITEFDEQSILQARDNIERYTPTHILELDLPVWLISTIMLRCLNNNYVTRKFVANYGKSFEHRLLQGKDIYDKELRTRVLEFLGIRNPNISFTKVRTEQYVKIGMVDYLEILEDGLSVSAPQFQLVNQIVHVGSVFIELQPFIYLLRLALERRLLIKIKSMKLYTDNEFINRCVKELKEKYPPEDQYINVKNSSIAAPIKELISKAYETHHLSHGERIRLGIYLQGRNYSMDYILDIFKQLSDYSEKTTKYQLQSLRKYIKNDTH